MGLGINKDRGSLAHAVQRQGGTVEITSYSYVRWTVPYGAVIRTGLTISPSSTKQVQRRVQDALNPRP